LISLVWLVNDISTSEIRSDDLSWSSITYMFTCTNFLIIYIA
jgi:hypothetical protein